MNRQKSIEQLNAISKRFDQLQTENKSLVFKLSELQNANKELENDFSDKEDVMKSLENQIKILKIAKGSEGKTDEEVKALKLRINAIIREVDKCISYLKS